MASVKLGTRGSRLALWQAEWCKSALLKEQPGLSVEIIEVQSAGDVDQSTPLTSMGEVGIFTRRLEHELKQGNIDLAVHSLKDVPAQILEGTAIVAVSEREDPRDALFVRSGSGLADLAQGAKVGTGSLRRRAQLRQLRPDLEMVSLRGNLDTRWKKFEAGEFDAMILAAAGVIRLGWADRIDETLSVDQMLPAVGQGVIGLQARIDSSAAELAAAIDHVPTHARVQSERSLLETIAGGCVVPLAGFAELGGELLHLRARLGNPDSGPMLEAEHEGHTADALKIGKKVGEQLLAQGGADIVAAAKSA